MEDRTQVVSRPARQRFQPATCPAALWLTLGQNAVKSAPEHHGAPRVRHRLAGLDNPLVVRRFCNNPVIHLGDEIEIDHP